MGTCTIGLQPYPPDGVGRHDLRRSGRLGADAGGALARKAVEAGLLEERNAGFYIAPVPSLIAHIEKLGRGLDELPTASVIER